MRRLLFAANGSLVLNHRSRWSIDSEQDTVDDPPSLPSLPLEILHAICGHMSSIGLQRFRLVCRLFGDVGIRHLATGAYLCPTRLSLKRLDNLSQTELINSIKSLFIAAEHIDFCHTYEECRYLKVPFTWSDESPTEKELRRRYSICRRAFAEQYELLQQGILTKSLTEFAKRSPKLDSLYLSFANGLWIPPEAPRAVRSAMLNMPEEIRPHYDLGIAARILTIFQNKGLRDLQMSYLPLEAIAREANVSDIMAIRNVMSTLESLALGVAHEPTAPDTDCGSVYWPDHELFGIEEHADTIEGQISSIISAAPNLRHLRFETRLDPERALDGCYLNTMFDVRINCDLFPNLCSLSLERIKISGRTFQEFLLAHDMTIKFIRLKDIQMNDFGDEMDWWQFWTGITGKLPQLQKFFHYGRMRDMADLDWNLGSITDGRSSIWTHVMDKYIRKGWPLGGQPPFEEDQMKIFYVPNPVVFESEGTKTYWNGSNQYIEEPDTDHEQDVEDEDEERFQRMHSWD